MTKNKIKKILFVLGTRPEMIKLAPLIKLMKDNPKDFKVAVCATSQHKEMLKQSSNFFDIKFDYDLNLMHNNQDLFSITSLGMKKIKIPINDFKPDYILVEGDTLSVFVGALAGFYEKIKIIHVEAGLRSYDKFSPFPEEMFRVLVTKLADIHFAPSKGAAKVLSKDGISKSLVYNVGNTGIDSLFLTLKYIKSSGLEEQIKRQFSFVNFKKKIILITCHRRESFGEPLKNICRAISKISSSFSDVEIILPVHPNPNVRKIVNKMLKNRKGIHLIEPLEYPSLVWLMKNSYLVITDSGGIQEEAPSLGIPVLVTRNVTERIEGIKSGNAKLVGSNISKIVDETSILLKNRKEYEKMSKARNPYGDGTASNKIVEIIKKQ